jgi:putative membrane protein
MNTHKSYSTKSHHRYLLIFTVLFAIEWLALAIQPYDRHDWLFENALVFLFVAVFALTFRRFPLSRLSITLIFIFL